MALIKNIELENGIIGNYLRIISLKKNFDVGRGNETIISIELYLNQNSRSNKKPVSFIEERIIECDSYSEAYVELKKLENYSESVDA